jgi:hypothetical protein
MKNLTYIFIFLSTCMSAQEKVTFRFSFNPGKEIPGYTKVGPENIYSSTSGFGFDFGTLPKAIDRGGKNALTGGFVTSDNPFCFSKTD